MKAIVLLSGGIDSTTCLAIAKQEFKTVIALSFNYKQRHIQELVQAARIAEEAQVKHSTVYLTMPDLKSALTSNRIEVPKDRLDDGSIPITYVPGRNTIFLSIAAGLAESLGFTHIIIGANAVDYSGYPDCRPEFIKAFNQMLEVNSVTGIIGDPIRVYAPIIQMTKAQIIQQAHILNAPLRFTTSCYDPLEWQGDQVIHCNHCDSCKIRKEGFELAQVPDPTIYAE